MPIIKSARKALKIARKRTARNQAQKQTIKKLAKSIKDEKDISRLYSLIDKAKKKNVINGNKAARLKSGLTKKLTKKTADE